MQQATKERTAKDLTLRLLEVLNTHDWGGLDDVFAKDVVIEWPQSRERIVGRENIREIFRQYPQGPLQTATSSTMFVAGDEDRFLVTPMFTVVRAENSGDTATSIISTRYPDGTEWYVISIATAAHDRIVKNIQYFAPCYDPPDWRAQWVQRME